MKRMFIIGCIIALLFNCANQQSGKDALQYDEKDISEAVNYYNDCHKVATIWFSEFEKEGYRILLKFKLPESFRSNWKWKEEGIIGWANENEKVFGKVKERKFMGAHVWLGDKLLTWAPGADDHLVARLEKPEVKDHFCVINPRFMGLKKASDMFRNFPDGKYVILMYKSVPSCKQYAEEKVILWQNETGIWQVVSYAIADDI